MDMQINKATSVRAISLQKAGKAIRKEQVSDGFKKAEFNMSAALTTLQELKDVNGKDKFKEDDIKLFKYVLTENPEKWNSIKTLASKDYIEGETVTQLSIMEADTLEALVPFATASKKNENNKTIAKYSPRALMGLAFAASDAKQIKQAQILVQTNLSGENIAALVLKPELNNKFDKIANKVLDMEKVAGENLKKISFLPDNYDKSAYTIEAITKDNHIKTELLDKNLKRRAIEELSMQKKDGKISQSKKTLDVENNTSSKVRRYISPEGIPITTHEVRVIKDKLGNIKRREYTAPSEIKGVLDSFYVDAQGNKVQVSEGHYDKKTGITTVKKNMESLDGTKTTYLYEDDPQGNRISEYKIVDKNGNVLLNKNSTFEVIDENHFVSTCNDDKYDITVDEHNISVQNMKNPDRKAVISIDKSIEGDKTAILKSLKSMPGEELFKVAESTKKLVGNDDVLSSYYMPQDKSIHSGSDLFVILHELGHARDMNKIDTSSDEAVLKTMSETIRESSDVKKTFEEEKAAFTKAFPEAQREHIDYFINSVTHYAGETGGLGETIAESNALLTTPKSHEILAMRSQYLQQYFPKTIALMAEKLSV